MTQQEIKDFRAQASYLNPEQLDRAVAWRIAANARCIEQHGFSLAQAEAMEKYMSD